MNVIANLPVFSRVSLFVLLGLIVLFTCLLLAAQIGCLSGKPFNNPDGTKDDWREQRLFYGIAWADIFVACPTSFIAVLLAFLIPRWGFYLMGMVSFFFVWANVMSTATSLRFERPKLTLSWIVVFPLGSVIGLLFLVWMLVHFEIVFSA